jgi:hypothetical protein
MLKLHARRILKAARVMQERELPAAGMLSNDETAALALKLERVSDRSLELPLKYRRNILEAEGYLKGLTRADEGNSGGAMFSWVSCALVRSIDNRHAESDEILSKVFRLLAREYVRFADWATASELYYYSYLKTAVQGEIPKSYAQHVVCTYRWGHPRILPVSIDRFEEGLPEDRQVQHFVQLIRAIIADEVPDSRYTSEWLLEILPLGTLAYTYSASAIGRWLRTQGRNHASFVVLGEALLTILKRPHDPWLIADLEQELAITALEAGRHEQALEYALKAWVRFDAQRYKISEHRLRATAWERFSEARYVALTAADQLGDSRTVTELIEACRLQSRIVTELYKETDTNDTQRANGVQTRRELEDQALQEEINVPAALFQAFNDSTNSTALTPPPTVTFQAESILRAYGTKVQKSPNHADVSRTVELAEAIEASQTEAWWAAHVERGRIFWSLVRPNHPMVTGRSDISDNPHVSSVLYALAKESNSASSNSLECHPGFECDPLSALASWNSPEERFITDALGQLIPDPLIDMLLSSSSTSRPLKLTIGAPSELAYVPWPIAVIARKSDSGLRLVECAAVTMWTSATSEIGKLQPPDKRQREIKFHISCDNPTGDLHPRDTSFAPVAEHNFGPARESGCKVATMDALIGALNDCKGKRPGLLFFRGHAVHYDDPAYSALALANGDAIMAGQLFGRFSNDSPYMPMPERVILSCCSSSTGALLGGEGIGFIAGLVHAGAQEIVATAVDVYDTSFTCAFDDMLIETMLKDGDHAVLLRNLHLRLLNEWKVCSVRGLIEYEDDIKDPHPLIWASYHAY